MTGWSFKRYLPPNQPSLTRLLDSFGLLALSNFLEERFGPPSPTSRW
jgi:hypothetical protein